MTQKRPFLSKSRLIEVKASTSVKGVHVLDCAIQDWVLRNSVINGLIQMFPDLEDSLTKIVNRL